MIGYGWVIDEDWSGGDHVGVDEWHGDCNDSGDPKMFWLTAYGGKVLFVGSFWGDEVFEDRPLFDWGLSHGCRKITYDDYWPNLLSS